MNSQRVQPSAVRALKVLHLLAPARFGGLERVVHALATGQKAIGYDVGVVMLLESGVVEPPLADELHEAGVTIIRVVRPARAFRAQRHLVREICRRTEPDILHSHGYLPDVLASSLGQKFPAARVSTVHGFTGGGWRNRFYEWLQRRSYARFDAIVAVSKKLALDLTPRAARGALQTLPNAWMPPEEQLSREAAREALSLSLEVFLIGWIGRISREKGADILIEALPALTDIKLHVTLIGSGVERTKLEHRVKQLQLDDRVSFHGEVARASRLFPAFDLFVLSSRTEGTPITLFEAMHAGAPIVATSVGGVPDVVSSEDALLIPPEDPLALASAIRDVHDHPVDAARRALHAGIRLERDFAATPWLESYERIYRNAVAGRTRT
ncbi:MAG: glycosyltransferase [Gemmatimonadota bacterium]|nr:glycosyltransferase [Gemmatimonadota bacterium]